MNSAELVQTPELSGKEPKRGFLLAIVRRMWRWLPWWMWAAFGLVLVTSALFGWQNYAARMQLTAAVRLDNSRQYVQAQKKLAGISTLGVVPHYTRAITKERQRSQTLLSTEARLAEAEALLKANNPEAAQAILKDLAQTTTGQSAPAAVQAQLDQLQQTAQKKTTSTKTAPGSGSTPSTGSSGGASTGSGSGSSSGGSGSSGGGSGSGGSGSSGGSGGTTTPPPPGPMTAITVTSFSPSVSAYTSTACALHESVGFSVDGTGSVTVTWEVFSTKTISEIDNTVSYSFSAAGSKTDTNSASLQGLEPGDSYRVSAVITDTANGGITTTAGPSTFSTCAAPQSLLSPSQSSFMGSPVTPGSLNVSQMQDSIFTNECSMTLHSTFSVGGPGSVQVTYLLTSGSSIGATLYSSSQESFSGPGSDADTSYIRMPHLPSGSYAVTATFHVLGDPSKNATSSPTTVSCD